MIKTKFIGSVITIAMIYCRILALFLFNFYTWRHNSDIKLTPTQLHREQIGRYMGIYMHAIMYFLLAQIKPLYFQTDIKIIPTAFMLTLMYHIFIVEPLYYFVHILLHDKRIYKHMHKHHHLSCDTTPYTALVQDNLEHVLYILTFGPSLFFPIFFHNCQSAWVMIIYLCLFDVLNAYGHSNMPNNRLPILYNPVDHHVHHKVNVNKNFGLFTTVCDKLCSTYIKRDFNRRQDLYNKQPDMIFIGHAMSVDHIMKSPQFNRFVSLQEIKLSKFKRLDMAVTSMICNVYRKVFNDDIICGTYYVGDKKCKVVTIPYGFSDYLQEKKKSEINDRLYSIIKAHLN